MRVLTVSREAISPYLEISTQHLVGILAEISKNPSNPRFNHYLFESLAALIRCVPFNSKLIGRFVGPMSPENLALLERNIVPHLLNILSQGVEGSAFDSWDLRRIHALCFPTSRPTSRISTNKWSVRRLFATSLPNH